MEPSNERATTTATTAKRSCVASTSKVLAKPEMTPASILSFGLR